MAEHKFERLSDERIITAVTKFGPIAASQLGRMFGKTSNTLIKRLKALPSVCRVEVLSDQTVLWGIKHE